MPRKKREDRTPIASVKHGAKRVVIPTTDLRDFVEEEGPRVARYERDPTLDPQLVWKGKDEQDSEDLAVPILPVYIQEKIQPQAIIEDLRAQAKRERPPEQPSLFAEFNGIGFDEMTDFYRHTQNWSNRMILGDSLLVMTSLAEKEGLKGQVQMIYLDPPYGIKFGSNWQVSTRKRDVKDGKADDLTRQPEQVRAFRDTWELGIHSYLSYLRDRLTVARDLLTESGSIFVQIGDENVHLVRCVLDEVFGRGNFLAAITFTKTGGQSDDLLAGVADYVLWYAKSPEAVKYRQLYLDKEPGGAGGSKYGQVELASGVRRPAGEACEQDGALPPGARLFRKDTVTSQRPPGSFPVRFEGRTCTPEPNYWKTGPEGFARLGAARRLVSEGRRLAYVRYIDDFPVFQITNVWSDVGGIQSRSDPKVYVVQTSAKVIERCLLMTTDPGDLVLDPTCGSGTTAYVAEQWGRRWITIDTSRVAIALARTRLMSAKYPYYRLADKTKGDIQQGFDYKTVPHITLKSIANNEEIDEIHARWQEKLEPLRAELNALCGTEWEEWEVPREWKGGPDASVADGATSHAAPPTAELLAEWWRMRRERQREIDESIARHADMETLYDQPYEEPKRVRVAGPFTVESLSPHRVVSPTVEVPASVREAQGEPSNQFVTTILENLKVAGVQNTIKNERMVFDWLKPFAGQYVCGEGQYTEATTAGKGAGAPGEGVARRVAVCIGPEHGTVGPDLVKEAAKEAVKGIGFDALIVCGFAFDPYVSEETKRYGKLTVLPARINPDIMMADVLKKTQAANLFMVFGEPDIAVAHTADGKLTVEVRGLDIYDPTTGDIRNHTTDDIACWFIDTDYNGESFFVRHAYFCGGDEPYDRLKRALRAEIDEGAWSALYSTQSRPFAPPESGRIAVKIINHYGDEVLKVYDVKANG